MFLKNKLIIALTIISSGNVFADTGLSSLNFDKNIESDEKKIESEDNELNLVNLSLIDLDEIISPELFKEDSKIKEIQAMIEKLDKKYKNSKIQKIKEIEGFYEVYNNGKTMYISEDGKYLIPKIAKVYGNTFEDIQKEKKENKYSELLNEYPEDMTILYPSTVKKTDTIYVFSDFTCPYCRRMHNEMESINRMGIEVKYLPYPRNGTRDQPAILGLQKIACSDTPYIEFNKAFEDPKRYVQGITMLDSSCLKGKQSIHNSLTLGDKVGVRGTPFILNSDGVYLGGWKGINTFKLMYESEVQRKKLKKGK